MTNLEKSAKAWLCTSLPPGSAVEELDVAHADLVLFDTWVAESVLPFLERGVWLPAVPDVLGSLEELTGQVEAMKEVGTNKATATAYLEYLDLLKHVYQDFLKAVPG